MENVNGILFNNTRWNNCSSLKVTERFIKFNNPKNNFNKVSGYISTQNVLDDNDWYWLKVYDSDLYDKYNEYNYLDELEEIFESNIIFINQILLNLISHLIEV